MKTPPAPIRATCTNDHRLTRFNEGVDQDVQCVFCEEKIPEKTPLFTCLHKDCDYYQCPKCNLKYFIRHSLVAQTSSHNYSEEFELQAVTVKKNEKEFDR